MSPALCLVLLYWRAAGTGVWLTAGSRGSRQLRNDTAVTTQSRNGLVVTSVVEMRSEDTNLKYIQGSSKEEREDIRTHSTPASPKKHGDIVDVAQSDKRRTDV